LNTRRSASSAPASAANPVPNEPAQSSTMAWARHRAHDGVGPVPLFPAQGLDERGADHGRAEGVELLPGAAQQPGRYTQEQARPADELVVGARCVERGREPGMGRGHEVGDDGGRVGVGHRVAAGTTPTDGCGLPPPRRRHGPRVLVGFGGRLLGVLEATHGRDCASEWIPYRSRRTRPPPIRTVTDMGITTIAARLVQRSTAADDRGPITIRTLDDHLSTGVAAGVRVLRRQHRSYGERAGMRAVDAQPAPARAGIRVIGAVENL
jgi:hypothetical protein